MRDLRGYDAWKFWPFHLFKRREFFANDAVHRGINGPLATAVAFQAPNAPRQTGVAVLSKLPIVGRTDALLPAIRMINRICVFLCLHNGLVEWLWWPRVGAYRATNSA